MKTNQLTVDDLENWVDDDSVGYSLGGEDEFSFDAPDSKKICISWGEQDDNDYGYVNIFLESDPAGFLDASIDDAYNRNSIDFDNPECRDDINKSSAEISAEIASYINEEIVNTYSYLLE